MTEPEGWRRWLQVPFVAALALGAALAWFTTEWGGLLVAGLGILLAVYFRYRHSD